MSARNTAVNPQADRDVPPLHSRRGFVLGALAALGAVGSMALAACRPGDRFGEIVFEETPPAEDASQSAEGQSAEPAESAVSGVAAQDAGRLYLCLPETIATLDPIVASGVSEGSVAGLVLEGLVRETDDGTGVEPCLAQSWDVDESGAVYTFTLPDGLVFSDGSPVTADDWAWSFERALSATDAWWSPYAEAIESVEVPDDQTVVVTFSEAGPTHASILGLGAFCVQSCARFEAAGGSYARRAGGVERAPIGTGAWAVASWDKDAVVLAANPNYRAEGLPLLEGIVVSAQADESERVLSIQRGDVDVAAGISSDVRDELESAPECWVAPDRPSDAAWVTPEEYAAAVGADQEVGAGGDPGEGDGADETVDAGHADAGDPAQVGDAGAENVEDAGDPAEADASPAETFLALRKEVSGVSRTPLGSWRLDSAAKQAG